MNNSKLQVSIIMPVYNSEKTVKAAVKSILQQSLKNFELIIVDDCSSDRTAKNIRSLKDKRIVYKKNTKQKGVAHSLNIGLRSAHGEYIARMDADDLAHKDRLKIQSNFLSKNKTIMLTGSWAEIINEQDIKIGEKKLPIYHKDIARRIFRANQFVHPTLMFRRSLLTKYPKIYNEQLNGAEDYDLLLRVTKLYRVMNIPMFLLKYRRSQTGVSFVRLKHVELQALKARYIALTRYKYPFWNIVFMIKPLISFLIPTSIKHIVLYAKK